MITFFASSMFNLNKAILIDVEDILATSLTPEEDLLYYLTHEHHIQYNNKDTINDLIRVIVDSYRRSCDIYDDNILTTLDRLLYS